MKSLSYLLPLVSFLLIHCAGTARLESEKPSKIIMLDSDFKIYARLGDLPMDVPEEIGVRHFAISTPGRDYDYLVMVDPADASEVIRVPISEEGLEIESAGKNGPYVDKILNVHRLILAGRLAEAKLILTGLVQKSHHSYGTLVMAGLIALTEKKYLVARQNFQRAAQLLPESQIKNIAAALSDNTTPNN